ncbi:sigma-70 family RNA polymerase sigma factor [Streptomyces sp. ME02-6987-2C]|uniref:sigma-70 family RNA polymerase sigma factor n=1 Tax=unclassified Streptomyces TaxID=2593676 RepID=UPI00299FCACC|nr:MULTISPECIES: sigma-70 family RNA polymerase sigma factor [unclassified Streptomyces]MDX3345930.1 sigma-70 family RNA polymerase sigma factor [Streptomyces sp. ME02-6979A]MDX3371980.1 sigma-70 family RNA polymerase sigma factor [Streptomyces sp. ME02-6987-2C]MDX3410540.1 sigma-70 family RNA polymerase sigma factor [Streptomyces sp. ME02-6977A]MDX3421696.1 sigma-70 family RNA polymerase sigma factor [Streptomyces sp. ME02-6985-2c]
MAAIELPEPFAALADLLTADPTTDQARKLTAALNSVPELQRWLREQRQITVRGLLDANHTAAELAPVLQVSKQRVYDIASGHVRNKSQKASYKAD